VALDKPYYGLFRAKGREREGSGQTAEEQAREEWRRGELKGPGRM